MVNVVEVFLVRETLQASATWYGVAGGAYGLGAFAGALLGGRLRGTGSLARGLVAAATVLCAGLAAMGAVPSVELLLPCGFIAGVGNGVLNVTVASLIMGRAHDAERGRVGALLTGVASGTQLAAYALAGALAGPFTPREIFLAAGLLGMLAPLALGRPLLRAANAVPFAPAATANSPSGAAIAGRTGANQGS
jgi:MFS family permease